VKSRATGSILAIAVAVIGIVVLVFSRSVAVEAVYPVERVGRMVRTGLWPRLVGVFRGSAAEAENIRLRNEIAAQRVLEGDLERLRTENARLRRVLDYATRNPEKWIPAGVLSRGGGAASFRDTLRVDKGSLSGVQKGAAVVVPEGLVGRVVAVSPHTSEVALVTDPALKVACEVETGRTVGVSGVLCGGSDELLVVRYLNLRGAGGIPPNARVFTSGRGGLFPRGIEIGIFLSQTNDVRGVVGDVLPRVGYSTLEDVFIRHAR